MGVAATPDRSVPRSLVISWCSFLRRSTIEKNARICGRRPLKPATNSVSWSSVRTDSVVGISGTSSTSAACMTFSETSEMLGGQSRNTWSYSAASGLSSWPSLRVGFLSAPPAEEQVHVAVGEVGGEQVQVVEVGALDRVVEGLGAADERLAAALDPGLDPEQEAGRALRVQVPEQRAVAVGGGQVGQVDGRGRLADAALDVVGGEDLHERPSSRTRTRSWPAGPANLANLAAKSARASAWLSASFAAISPMASSVAAGAGAARPASRRPASWISCALHLAVLELAEAVLQLLEVADHLAVRDRVVQRREELQQVAQLLGALAQVVQGFGGESGVIAPPCATIRRNERPVVDRASATAEGRRLRGPSTSRISSSALRQSSVMARNRGPRSAAASRRNSRARRRARKARSGSRSAGDAATSCPAIASKPSRWTSRSRVGVVRSPSHLNSAL